MICYEEVVRNINRRPCDNPLVKGIYGQGWLIKRKDVSWTWSVAPTENYGNYSIISALAPAAGKKFAKVLVPERTAFQGTKTDFAAGTYENSFTNTAAFVILNQGPIIAQSIIYPLANEDWVLVFQRKDNGENSAFQCGSLQVFGLEQGLRLSEGSSEPWSDETRGGWSVTMQETGARLPGVYFKGDTSKPASSEIAYLDQNSYTI